MIYLPSPTNACGIEFVSNRRCTHRATILIVDWGQQTLSFRTIPSTQYNLHLLVFIVLFKLLYKVVFLYNTALSLLHSTCSLYFSTNWLCLSDLFFYAEKATAFDCFSSVAHMPKTFFWHTRLCARSQVILNWLILASKFTAFFSFFIVVASLT